MVLIQPFPQPGRLVHLAYRELDLATSRQQDHLLPLRDLANVPRPWDLGTCETPQLRKEVWSWLEAIVTWLNHEYVWDVADVVPPAGRNILTLWTRSLFSPISTNAPVKRSPVRRWRSGIGTACPPSPNGCGRNCGTTVEKIISRGRPRALHPPHRRSELPQAGRFL